VSIRGTLSLLNRLGYVIIRVYLRYRVREVVEVEWRDGVRCPICQSRSEVASGKPPNRWRKCLNKRCGKSWKTLEVSLHQARELQTWYTEMVEKHGAGWAPLFAVASEVYDRAVELGLMLGVLKEVSNVERERGERGEITAGAREG
jgi:hypothetical protein